MKQLLIILAVSMTVVFTGCRETMGFYQNNLRSNIFKQDYSTEKYDFLWVMDNSDSMTERRNFVRDNLESFLNTLSSRKAIDYQMAVVTTDYFNDHGALVAATDGTNVVKSTAANPIADFAGIINNIQDSPTSFWEQGLESSYQAVYKHGSKFMREGVPLIVIYVTDEEDWSCKDECWGVQPENNTNYIPFDVSRYIAYFENVKKSEDSEVSVFPIVGTAASQCEIASRGNRYIALQENIGNLGKSASICNSDLEESYNGIAQVIANRGNVFKLESEASGKKINVYINGTLVPFSPENYIFDAATNSIIFTGAAPKKGEVVEVSYTEKTI